MGLHVLPSISYEILPSSVGGEARVTNPALRVLLIEDSESYAGLVKFHLMKAIAGLQFLHATKLEEGVRIMEREGVDAVILDLNLPDSQGIDTFSELQRRAPATPVIVLTGNEDDEISLAAMRMGAQDYFNKNELDGKLLARSLRYAIERFHREEEKRALDGAGAIQRSLFPEAALRVDGIEIAGRCDPMRATGGDYFDYFYMVDGSLAFVVADVSGHGIGPALIMAETRAAIRILATIYSDLGVILTHLNRFLTEHLQSKVFVSLFIARFEPVTHTLYYASAGHPAVVLDANGIPRLELNQGGIPLGIASESEYKCPDSAKIQPGEIVLIHTDGITETVSSCGEMFQLPRILSAVQECREKCAREIVDHLFHRAREFADFSAPHDDMTAVVVKVFD